MNDAMRSGARAPPASMSCTANPRAAAPLDAGPQFFLWLIFRAPSRRMLQSFQATTASGATAVTHPEAS